jgi:pimeloyl-ACP methyl ester carboxylesterase
VEQSLWLPCGEAMLAMSLHRPARNKNADCKEHSKYPTVVFCHGFVGNRIGVDRLFVHASRLFEQHGFMVLRFDYAGCGESTGDYGSTGLASMMEQTQHVLDYVFALDEVDVEHVTLLGHSLGGAVAVLTAVQDPRVRNLVLWSAVAHPFEEIVGITGKDILNHANTFGRATYRGYHLTPMFYNSLKLHDPLSAATQFKGHALVVHGRDDLEISAENGFLYWKALRSNATTCRVEVLKDADHTYSCSDASERLRELTVDWLQEVHETKRGSNRLRNVQ